MWPLKHLERKGAMRKCSFPNYLRGIIFSHLAEMLLFSSHGRRGELVVSRVQGCHDTENWLKIINARKRSLRRLCFYTCLSVHRGEYLSRSPWAGTSPPLQVPPLGRYTPWAGTPPGRYPPVATVHAGIRSIKLFFHVEFTTMNGSLVTCCNYHPGRHPPPSQRETAYWSAFLFERLFHVLPGKRNELT